MCGIDWVWLLRGHSLFPTELQLGQLLLVALPSGQPGPFLLPMMGLGADL